MTQILTLPLDLSAEGSRRLAAGLRRDACAGVDLGSRRAQIDCLSATLSRSLQDLGEALGRAVADLPEGDPALARLREAVAGMTRVAQVVMAGAAGLGARPVAEA